MIQTVKKNIAMSLLFVFMALFVYAFTSQVYAEETDTTEQTTETSTEVPNAEVQEDEITEIQVPIWEELKVPVPDNITNEDVEFVSGDPNIMSKPEIVENEDGSKSLSLMGEIDEDLTYIGQTNEYRIKNTPVRFRVYLKYYAVVYEAVNKELYDATDGYEGWERRPEMDYEMGIVNQSQVEAMPYWIYPTYELYDRSQLQYNGKTGRLEVHQIYVKETGPYTMDSSTQTGNLETTQVNYVIRGMARADGTPIGDANGVTPTAGDMYIVDENGNREKVWCIEPEVLTWNGSKYDVDDNASANVKAAIASVFGSWITNLDKAIMECYVWSTVGYCVPFDQLARYTGYDTATDTYKFVELTDEEKAYVKNMVHLLDTAYNAYSNDEKARFISKTQGVEVKDDQLVIYGTVPTTIELEAQNPEVLSFYASRGHMVLPEGVQASVEGNILRFTIAEGALQAGNILSLSMIPVDFPTNTKIYDSPEWTRQKLAHFGLADKKYENLYVSMIEVNETVVPVVHKVLNGATIQAGQFSFHLIDQDGNVVDTARNDASGNVTFQALTFHDLGVYTYTIEEVNDGQKGVTYDTNVYTWIVEVGVDSVKVSSDITFENGYEEDQQPPKEEEEKSEPKESKEPKELKEPKESKEVKEVKEVEEVKETETSSQGIQTGSATNTMMYIFLMFASIVLANKFTKCYYMHVHNE